MYSDFMFESTKQEGAIVMKHDDKCEITEGLDATCHCQCRVSIERLLGERDEAKRVAQAIEASYEKDGAAYDAMVKRVADLAAAATFKRNTIIHNDPRFKGEWVAVPREDFDRLRALLAGK